MFLPALCRRASVRLLLCLALPLAAPSAAQAWSPEGHRMVADVAMQFLTPAAKARVQALLVAEKTAGVSTKIKTLADASTWPDEVRSKRPETATWHYDDVPVCGVADPALYCPKGNCASVRIEEARKVLANPAAPLVVRVEALNFLVHFVGDVHQPLHAADNHDRGGNDVPVVLEPGVAATLATMRAEEEEGVLATMEAAPVDRADIEGDGFHAAAAAGLNLHRIWDTELVRRFLAEPGNTATGLAKSVSAADVKAWQATTPTQWVAEAHQQAVQFTYGLLPVALVCNKPPTAQVRIGEGYYAAARPVLAVQIKRAGVRLAGMLNKLFPK